MPENVNTSVLVADQSQETSEDDRPVMVSVEHVSMSFNMASEKLNNLKEYALALAKRKLFFEEFKALDDVSFEVRKGDVFGIMGTNGSGKSTILKIIAGVLEPTAGTCHVNGNIAPLIELGAGFDMDLSARENIYLNGALLGYSKQFIDDHFDEIVEFAEIEKFLDMPMKNYSSGMVARIAFSIATVIVPEILVVDEVLSVGDFMFQKKCEDRITELIEHHGVTVLIVSHSNEQIARLCNRVIWIEKGRSRLQGSSRFVCEVYEGLAGRTGSSESEQRVFENLLKIAGKELPENVSTTISGNNFADTTAELALETWSRDGASVVALVSGVSHPSAIVGGVLASACQAPLFTMGNSGKLPKVTEQALKTIRPEEILVFDSGDDLESLIDDLEELPWLPRVIRFGGKGRGLFSFSLEVFEYGKRLNCWKGSPSLIGFKDNYTAFLAAPFNCDARYPVIMFDSDGNDVSRLVDGLSRFGINQVYLFGRQAGKCGEGLRKAGIDLEVSVATDRSDDNLAVSQFVFDYFDSTECQGDKKAICVAAKGSGQWLELLGCGVYAANKKAPLLLIDQTNLDEISSVLDFIKNIKRSVDTIVYIGANPGVGRATKRILSSELL